MRTTVGILGDLRAVDARLAALAAVEATPAIRVMAKGLAQIRDDLRTQLASLDGADHGRPMLAPTAGQSASFLKNGAANRELGGD